MKDSDEQKVEQITITALITTYRRPQSLVRCLEALKKQSRIPDEVLVVVRDADVGTWTSLERIERRPLILRMVTVWVPGSVAALNAGLEAAKGDIIAITDDDAAPRPDWLARIEAHLQNDPKLGGVGGRDWVHHGERVEDGARKVVGKVQWFGRVIGNHHLGVGGPREVDVLKGANCAYRRAALLRVGFDKRMLGTGTQLNWELSLGLQLRRMGYKLIYDPAVTVDHYRGPRFGEGQRDRFEAEALTNETYNEALSLLEYLTPMRRLVFMIWSVFVGTRAYPGLVQWLRFSPREGRLAGKKLQAALTGRIQAFNAWRCSS
jgi:cellulose synthase/poly-beta-1,6-N-acetylglucosamine synthase-like glycosyltransferase